MDTEDIEKAVEERRVWLQGQLEAAAPRFGVELVGEIVNTCDMRSAGAMAPTTCGCALDIRVIINCSANSEIAQN